MILDCAGLGGWEASARDRRWRFERYVTLTTPLLRYMDEWGSVLGGAAATAELARQSAAAAAAAPRGFPPPHVRWAYFYPRAEDIELLRRLASRDQVGGAAPAADGRTDGLSGALLQLAVCVERAWGWREASAAYARAAQGHARGKLLLDFAAS